MSCLFPQGVYDRYKKLSLRPCGQCMSCRIANSKQWALRCIHESMVHDENSFLTLTYNDENLPDDGSLDKRHFQKFMKKLRNKVDHPIRYFACGEYGDNTFRPHYHLCLFGHDFKDKEPIKAERHRFQTGQHHVLYKSDQLASIWGKGFCTVGDLTFESASYVARYVIKKIKGTSPEAVRRFKERYGDKLPEFALMSRMPGIGKPWFDKFKTDVYPKDFVTVNGRKYRPPRYYDSLYAREDPHAFEKIKTKRKESHDIEFPEDRESISRNKYRETLTKQFEREI